MMTRKQFFGSVAGMFGIAMLSACDSEGVEGPPVDAPRNPDSPTNPDSPADAPFPDANTAMCGTTAVVIGTNHGHTLAVSEADVEAGVQKAYDITGSSGHPHTVLITAANFATLKSARSLSLTSTGGGHTHSVMITC